MGDHPCGCKLIEDAEREHDPSASLTLRTLGEQTAQAWKCPRFTGDPCGQEAPPEVRETIVAVERLTGASGIKTCPHHEADQIGVRIACQARQWAEWGMLEKRYGEPTLALMQAIELIGSAIAARDREERKQRDRNNGRND